MPSYWSPEGVFVRFDEDVPPDDRAYWTPRRIAAYRESTVRLEVEFAWRARNNVHCFECGVLIRWGTVRSRAIGNGLSICRKCDG